MKKGKNAKAKEQYADALAVEITATYSGENTYRNRIHKGDIYTINYDGMKERRLRIPAFMGVPWVQRTYSCSVRVNGKKVLRLEHSWVPVPITKEKYSPEIITKWVNDSFNTKDTPLIKVVSIRSKEAYSTNAEIK